jgi:hypothetical protein
MRKERVRLIVQSLGHDQLCTTRILRNVSDPPHAQKQTTFLADAFHRMCPNSAVKSYLVFKASQYFKIYSYITPQLYRYTGSSFPYKKSPSIFCWLAHKKKPRSPCKTQVP